MRSFFHQAVPVELLGIELLYFLVIAGLCWVIVSRTRELYVLSKHEGILHFRRMFLYFGFAYFFRFVHVLILLSRELSGVALPRLLPVASLVLVGYFSTLAILSLAMTVVSRFARTDSRWTTLALHAIAFASSAIVFATRSQPVLVLVQTIIFLGAVVALFALARRSRAKSLISQNRVTYALLFVFWVLNTLTLAPRLLPFEARIPLYLLSAAVFAWVFVRVRVRLHGEKKR